MKLKFHWDRETQKLLVHSKPEVDVILLSSEGILREGDKELTLEGEYEPRVPLFAKPTALSFSEGFGKNERAALLLRGLLPIPEWSPARIRWRLCHGGHVLQQGTSLWVSEKTLNVRWCALYACVASALVWALLLPGIKGQMDELGTLLTFVAGGVGVTFTTPLRNHAWRLLLHRCVALSIIAVCTLALGIALCGFCKVYNLSLTTCYFGEQALAPRTAGFVWGKPEPGCDDVRDATASAGPTVGPYHKSDVGGITAWLPWFRTREVECTAAVPSAFLTPWKASGQCAPSVLQTKIDLADCCHGRPLAAGAATLSYSPAGPAFPALACGKAQAGTTPQPCLYDRFRRITLHQLGGLEIHARGSHEIAEVSYSPLPQEDGELLLPLQASEASGGFEFSMGPQRLGSVTVQRFEEGAATSSAAATARPEASAAPARGLSCYRLASTLGVESVLSSVTSLASSTRTVIADPEGTIFAPLCFEGEDRPDEALIVFAAGWSPRTAHALELPCARFPRRLDLRSHVGEWLGRIEMQAAPPHSVQCRITVHPVAWHATDQPVLAYDVSLLASSTPAAQAMAYQAQVPQATAELGQVAWAVERSDAGGKWPGTSLRLDVMGAGGEVLVFDHDGLHAERRGARDYFYRSKTDAFSTQGCPAAQRTEESYATNLARSRGISFRKVYVCER